MKFFSESSSQHIVRGEFTPHYFYNTDCIDRIRDFGIRKVVLTLRDPVDRVWSNYQFKRKQDGFEGSLNQFLEAYPEMVSWSTYASHLGPWLDAFGSNLCILVYEEVSRNHQALASTLSSALGLSEKLFMSEAGVQRVNASSIPKRRMIYRMSLKANRWLMDRDFDVVVNSLKQVPGLMKFLRQADQTADLELRDKDVHQLQLAEMFLPSVSELQSMVNIDVTMWKSLR